MRVTQVRSEFVLVYRKGIHLTVAAPGGFSSSSVLHYSLWFRRFRHTTHEILGERIAFHATASEACSRKPCCKADAARA